MINKQRIITSSLPKEQYIEFLKFCKKQKLTKFAVVQDAILSYCKLAPINHPRGNIDDELKELLKDD